MHPRLQGLPTFIVIGAMKSGTTSLYEYISAHPGAFTTTPKEPEFFSTNWDRGLDWYRNAFAGAEEFAAAGEFSTSYTKYPFVSGVAERMALVIPDVKLVYVVRDPVERIRSMYMHEVVRGRERESFDRAVRRAPQSHLDSYLDLSRYAYQLGQYLEHFSREQILVIRSEDLRDQRAATMTAVFEFLGLDPSFEVPGLNIEHFRSDDRRIRRPVVADVAALVRKSRIIVPRWIRHRLRGGLTRQVPRPKVSDETAAWILHELAPDLDRLLEIMGSDFKLWHHP